MANLLIRKRLAALRDAARGAMRPDGQGDGVMGMLDRVKDANRRAEEENAGAFRLRLSTPVIAAILVVMAVSVGWTWYMGYMVGQGQDPVVQAGRLAQTALPGAAAPEADPEPDAAPTAPSGEIVEPEPPARGGAAAARNAAQKAAVGAPAAPAAKAAPAAAKAKEQPRADAKRPGDARKPETAKADAKRADAKKADARKADAKKAEEARRADARKADTKKDAKRADDAKKADAKRDAKKDAPQGGRFDMVFQVGAFKGPVDSGRLRERLEAKGFRATVRPSGKVFLVTVSLRGDAKAADRLRAEAGRLGLGAPILLSRKEVGGR